jgi:hypothetical protein
VPKLSFVDPPPASAVQKGTSPPRAWRGLAIARRFPTSTPGASVPEEDVEPLRVDIAATPLEPLVDEPPVSDEAPPALRGDALARALDALK